MKKKFLIIAVLLCLMAAFLAFPVSAAEGTYGDNITWTFDNGTLTISGTGAIETSRSSLYPWSIYSNKTTAVIIKPGITSIGFAAFRFFRTLSSVSLPSTVTTIEGEAFRNCVTLSAPPLSNSITSLGNSVFHGCSSFQSVTIPSGLSEIPRSAFSGCSSLRSVTIPNTVTTIGGGAFNNCSNLTQITIPNSVTTIGGDAFSNCSNLTQITIPNSVTAIGGSAFSGCTKLSDVKLSSNLTNLGDNAFSGCSNLTQITIPDTVTAINSGTFTDCTSLESIYLGAGISSIDSNAFWRCTKLKAFTVSPQNPYFTTDNGFIYNKSKTELVCVPQGYQGRCHILPGTTKILAYACYECAGITDLIIPDSVNAIGNDAFFRSGIRSVSLSNSLTSIGERSFAFSSFIKEITFPASLTAIGQLAFEQCTSLSKITFLGMAPWIASDAFSDVKATVYYPTNKPGWKDSQDLYDGLLHWEPLKLDCNGAHTSTAMPTIYPTCTSPGSTSGTKCSVCNTVLTQPTTVPATGHKYSAWSLQKKPVMGDPGVAQRQCGVCYTWESKEFSSMAEFEAMQEEAAKTEPPVTEPPATEPPVTKPPATKPSKTEPPVTEPPVTEPSGAAPTESTAGTEPVPTENSPSSPTAPNTPSDTNAEKPGKSRIRAWVIGISTTVVLGAAVAATAVAVIYKKKK